MVLLDRRIIPIVLGESLEAYDFFLYGLLSVFIAKTFFPQHGTELTLTYSFTLFSVAYIARPLGSIIWGHIADKYGRKKVLIGTLSLMAVPAVGMALMPSYDSIGFTATVAVVFFRFLQGIAFGGESPTVIVSLYEMAPNNRKGFYGSLNHPGALIGYVIGIIFVIWLTGAIGNKNMQDYGWRFLFAISLFFIAVLGYFRKKIIETSELKNVDSLPIKDTITKDWMAILKIVVYMSCGTVMFYTLLFHNYLVLKSSSFGIGSLIAQAIIVLFVIFSVPFFALLTDKIGNRRNILKITYMTIAFTAVFLYDLFLSESLYIMIVGYFLFAILTSIVCSTIPAVIIPQVSKTCRVSTIGIAVGLSTILGSFIPLANESIKAISETPISPSILIVITAFVSFAVLFFMENKEEKEKQ